VVKRLSNLKHEKLQRQLSDSIPECPKTSVEESLVLNWSYCLKLLTVKTSDSWWKYKSSNQILWAIPESWVCLYHEGKMTSCEDTRGICRCQSGLTGWWNKGWFFWNSMGSLCLSVAFYFNLWDRNRPWLQRSCHLKSLNFCIGSKYPDNFHHSLNTL
jgi:hypothetical protein